MLAITEEMREAARKLLMAAKLTPVEHKRLDAIANGTRKRIDDRWWNEIHRVVAQAKLDKLSRLADPARNPNPHERELASAKLAEFKGRRPPGVLPEPPLLPATAEEWMAQRKPTAKSAKPKAGPVNTIRPGFPARLASVNTTKPRSADRHREPNRDRHSPGYMKRTVMSNDLDKPATKRDLLDLECNR